MHKNVLVAQDQLQRRILILNTGKIKPKLIRHNSKQAPYMKESASIT